MQRVMAEFILAAMVSSPLVYVGFNHMCCKHNVLFTMEDMKKCDEISGCKNIIKFARRLEEQNIRD